MPVIVKISEEEIQLVQQQQENKKQRNGEVGQRTQVKQLIKAGKKQRVRGQSLLTDKGIGQTIAVIGESDKVKHQSVANQRDGVRTRSKVVNFVRQPNSIVSFRSGDFFLRSVNAVFFQMLLNLANSTNGETKKNET
ncbi:hypothetical protein DGG96_07410 [Legionella qingyii]|uniref:Uncharacterized protein n=1 Tax=Legionella qingyii TaxID=2184757 RepID=A0A317U2Q3_9GAMM|nr:hypothetical protein [Legionella qingyii]PWY56314.1 hypothetical protein DGG96_07410 [Legionella qingyii]